MPRPDAGEPHRDGRLAEVLTRAQDLGFLGAAPVVAHILHSEAFLAAVGPQDRVADLGSGAGLPGLVIAVVCPEASVRLVEASERRADHLRRSVVVLGLGARVVVDQRPAELVGRDPALRGSFDVVTARGFGPPPVVAECAAPLLRAGGTLVVSEPPRSDGSRWAGLGSSGIPLAVTAIEEREGSTIARLTLTTDCPDRFPRAVGVPVRRPVFEVPED